MSTQHTERVAAGKLTCGHMAAMRYSTSHVVLGGGEKVRCHQCPGRPVVEWAEGHATATYPYSERVTITASSMDRPL